MKVRLNGRVIAENTYTEEQLSELSVMESIYIIRKLKAVIEFGNNFIEVKEGTDNQVFCEKYDIWFQRNEYITQEEMESAKNNARKEMDDVFNGMVNDTIKKHNIDKAQAEKRVTLLFKSGVLDEKIDIELLKSKVDNILSTQID